MPFRKQVPVLLACLAGCALLLLPLQKKGEVLAAGEVEPPINITADQMEYLSEKGVVVFKGNALAVREDVTISAEKMTVTLSEEGERGSGTVKRIVAAGDVNLRQRVPGTETERFAKGDKGVYEAEGRVITLTGKPRVWEGKNVITGEKMTFYLDEHRFVVEGKVGLTVFPDKGKEKK